MILRNFCAAVLLAAGLLAVPGNRLQVPISLSPISAHTQLTASLPQIRFFGSMEGIGKGLAETDYVTLQVQADGFPEDLSGWAIVSTQGHSTLMESKKNYTVRLYRDEALTEKNRVPLFMPQAEHKYILKANYIDPTQCRNLAAAKLWGQMAATRQGITRELTRLANFGAVCGLPTAVWLNEDFLGVYTLNLHKDDDLFHMRQVDRNAIMIANAQTMEESLFRAEAVFEEDISDWEVEFCSEENLAWAKDSFNKLIRFVMDSDDTQFRNRLGDYLDVNGAIDYLIFLHALGLSTSGAKDLILLTYGDVWIPSVYDMETAFGLYPDGTGMYPPEYFLPDLQIGDSGTGSLLWDRLLQCYPAEITQRYAQLRQQVLTEENITCAVRELYEQIPQALFAADAALYPDMPQAMPEEILQYIHARLPLVDAAFGI